MLFKPEHIDLIIAGRKTQTRRVCKPNEERIGYMPGTRYERCVASLRVLGIPDSGLKVVQRTIKWQIGRTYAVQPGRGLPSAWWCTTPDGAWWDMNLPDIGELDDWPCRDDWRPLRIRITAIRQERLQDISEADAVAEGMEGDLATWHEAAGTLPTPREQYAALWDTINTRAGKRWADNPLVWALTFEVMRK